MQTFTDRVIRDLLSSSLKSAVLGEQGWEDVGAGPGSSEAEYVDWLTFGDLEKSVYEDVKRIRFHPLVPDEIPIYGFIYDVRTGTLIEIPEATQIGKPTVSS